jgi:hypothetical protein
LDVHYNEMGNQVLAGSVVKSIRAALSLAPPEPVVKPSDTQPP